MRERLQTLSAVTSIVGARIYQLRLPQNAELPAVRVQLISEQTSYHGRGGSGMYRSRVQVDAYAQEGSGSDPYGGAMDLGDAIHGDDAGAGLSAWQGEAGGSPPELRIHAVFRMDRQVGYDAEEHREVRCRQDYMVHWSRVS